MSDRDAVEDFIRLEQAPKDQQRVIANELIAKSLRKTLEIPPELDRPGSLAGVCLPGLWMPKAQLRGCDLRKAQLENTMLAGADLNGANLEQADLHEADLAGADLANSKLGECNLQEALLEEANFTQSTARFANLRDASMERAVFAKCDLWGANLENVNAREASFCGASLGEGSATNGNFESADFRDATLAHIDYSNASLKGARFNGATFVSVDFRGASLAHAHLTHVDLSTCLLDGTHFASAWLDRTRLRQAQLGRTVGEERSADWPAAVGAYGALERNFVSIGDDTGERWAYLRRRRMEKRAFFQKAGHALESKSIRAAIKPFVQGVLAQVSETVCDYGESVSRVVTSIVVVFAFFTLFYGLTGSVIQDSQPGAPASATRSIVDLTAFSLETMTTLGTPVGLHAGGGIAEIFRAIEALVVIFLTGLLGFVAGNRIRR